MGILGTMVSQKYEVDHGRIFIDMKNNLNESEKAAKHKEVDELEQKLYLYQAGWGVLIIIGIALPTGILIIRAQRRKKQRCLTQHTS